MNKLYVKLALCTLVAAVLALTSHIYISEWAAPLLAKMTEGLNPPNGNYPFHIMVAAYLTAFVTVGVLVFVYYHAGHLLTIPNSLGKVLVLTFIILEVKGSLLRQPLMDYLVNISLEGMQHPLAWVFLNHADKWVSGLLISVCLIYLCPTKYKKTGSVIMPGNPVFSNRSEG